MKFQANSQSSMKSPQKDRRDPRTKYYFDSPDKTGGPVNHLIQFRGVFNQIFNNDPNNLAENNMDKSKLSFNTLGHYNCPELEVQLAIFKFILDLLMKFDF